MRAIIVGLSFVMLLGLPASSASARALENWPYERLMKEADLVIVCVAKRVEECDDKATDPRMKDDFVARRSTLEVQGTLKGKAPGAEVKVLHFRLKEGILIENGPCLVEFRTQSMEVTAADGTKVAFGRGAEYLLFLKAGKNGQYEPLSGQYDPALSIREMYAPFSHDLVRK